MQLQAEVEASDADKYKDNRNRSMRMLSELLSAAQSLCKIDFEAGF